MPELHFDVRWPDGTTHTYYSPSTALREHLAAGDGYPLDEFIARARRAMHHASERVRARYGYACSSALDTLAQIEAHACVHAPPQEVREVRVVAIRSPDHLPGRSTST